ncbi:Coiled-coil and C2 domain-containing protein 1B [Saguinus oedipus]|uniref:Coiled-coil and C2 domain-containing protein 1B n=1 Tax=Saguinus oedipus TaxID=9490 RepID=A0ABQ9VEQ1_SAGOE|nr:Coiled-coil and C2 domain-containing protein 1B [Saguinus oedipus]
MPGPRPRKGPQASGQGVATAKQLGLFVEFGPEDMLLGMDEAEDDEDLEAELLALTGEAQPTGKKPAPKEQAPLPMAHIEKLAADCMQDVEEEEEEEEGLEEDAELLTELQEVLGVDEETEPLDGDEAAVPGSSEEKGLEDTEPPVQTAILTASAPAAQAGASQGLHTLLEERIRNYREAAASAKEAGEAAKARRCDRGLKTLESQLATVRRGRKINEDEIPPPVALGKRPRVPEEPANRSPEADPPAPRVLESDNPSQSETSLPGISGQPDSDPDPRALLSSRQREYKVAALSAKRAGDLDRARELMRIGKRFGAVLEALEKGQPVDLSAMPPAPEGQYGDSAGICSGLGGVGKE